MRRAKVVVRPVRVSKGPMYIWPKALYIVISQLVLLVCAQRGIVQYNDLAICYSKRAAVTV